MTVSSVKNLNGETFSAVQDASLTDIVSSNSANWNEISAYQANSANYLQNTDLATSDGKVTAISGIPLSAGGDVPEGVMVESGLEYDNTEISGYSGSAFKDVALTDVVTANSGVWGGSALPVSAGPGVKISLQNDTLVFSTDETVLFSGSNAWGYGTITLSESLKNFERIKVLATRAFTGDGNTDRYSGPWSEFECAGIANTTAAWGAVTPVIYEGPWWKFSTFTANSTFTELNWFEGGYIKVTNPSEYAAGSTWNDGKSCGIKAVIGVNRIAGGD